MTMEGLCEDCTRFETKVQTGLVAAAKYGQQKCVEVLTQAGADENKENDDCQTALIMAANNGHENCVGLLIKAGADVNKQESQYGNSALIESAQKWSCKMC